MALTKYEGESMDLGGFENVPAGDYIWQVQEGIELKRNNNPSKDGKIGYTYWLPLQAFMVVNGDEEAIDKKATLFISATTPFGEKQMSALLTFTGLIEGFLGAGLDDPSTEAFANKLKVKLFGKMFGAHHDIKKQKKRDSDDTMETMNFTKFWAFDSKNPKAVPGKDSKAPDSGDRKQRYDEKEEF